MQGYQLGPSQLDFAITIAVTSTTASGAPLTETLQLDPSDPYVLDDANLVSAQLLGDLLTYTALPVFTDTYLMVPSPTGSSLLPRVLPSVSTYMLTVQSVLLGRDSACNLVGYTLVLQIKDTKPLLPVCLAWNLTSL